LAVAVTWEFWIEGVCLILCVDCTERAYELLFQNVSKLNWWCKKLNKEMVDWIAFV
jgi:hypothetical protein